MFIVFKLHIQIYFNTPVLESSLRDFQFFYILKQWDFDLISKGFTLGRE